MRKKLDASKFDTFATINKSLKSFFDISYCHRHQSNVRKFYLSIIISVRYPTPVGVEIYPAYEHPRHCGV